MVSDLHQLPELPIGEGDPPTNGFRVYYVGEAGAWQWDVRARKGRQYFAKTGFSRWQWLAERRAQRKYREGKAWVEQRDALDV